MSIVQTCRLVGLGLLVVGFGAGCSHIAALDQACDWVPRVDFERLAGIVAASVDQQVYSNVHHVCSYKDENGNVIVQTSDSTMTVTEFESTVRNTLPTSEQPSIESGIKLGDGASFTQIGEVTAMLYVRVGKQGYLLTSTVPSLLSKEKLEAVAARLVERVK